MIVVRAPLRITLGGGGTDLPSYAVPYGGFCLTAAITQYVYVTVLRPFFPGIYLKYSALEQVATPGEVAHPLLRAVLQQTLPRQQRPQIEVTTVADIPAGTGLGSSSTFTVAALAALRRLYGGSLDPRCVAADATRLERDDVGSPVGSQDAYAAAYGGLQALNYPVGGGEPSIGPVRLPDGFVEHLEDHLLLYFTGLSRCATALLSQQAAATVAGDAAMLRQLDQIKAWGLEAVDALQAGEGEAVGRLFHAHWELKRQRAPGMTTPIIDAWYAQARAAGAIGGKLVGAGGGGCLLFYAEDPAKLRRGLKDSGLQEIRFRFDLHGVREVGS